MTILNVEVKVSDRTLLYEIYTQCRGLNLKTNFLFNLFLCYWNETNVIIFFAGEVQLD